MNKLRLSVFSVLSTTTAIIVLEQLFAFGAWASSPSPIPEAPAPIKTSEEIDRVRVAEGHKTLAYMKDGIYVGGDQSVSGVIVKDIRRAKNQGFERWVIDLSGTKEGEPLAIKRPPYFQVAVSPEEKRLLVSIWGGPTLAFDSKKLMESAKKSDLLKNLELFPRFDDDQWTFALNVKALKGVEVFELNDPVRIIIDVRDVIAQDLPKEEQEP